MMGFIKFIATLLCLSPVHGQVRPFVQVQVPLEQPQPELVGTLDAGTQDAGFFPQETPDFSNAEVQPDGSLCIMKTNFVKKLERQHIKECWHQNITACHETFITEFKPMQERKCDDNTFWKTCKISYKEISLNYTVETCFNPLVQECDEINSPPKEVCRTWLKTVCNTTYIQSQGEEYHNKYEKDIKSNTWCEKVPRKICGPDHCRYVEGKKECHEKTIPSTIVKPVEHCDLQPATDCQIVTNLIPHLLRQPICEQVPKEFCHMKLDEPKLVQKPVKMKWCTFPNGRPQRNIPESASFNLQLVQGEPTVPEPSIVGKRQLKSNKSTVKSAKRTTPILKVNKPETDPEDESPKVVDE